MLRRKRRKNRTGSDGTGRHSPSGREDTVDKKDMGRRYFHSGVFKRLFLVYAIIIVFLFLLVSGWYVTRYRQETETMTEREWSQRTAAWGTWMDQQLMQAQGLCAAINASESCRDVLRTAYVEKKTVDSLQLYNMLGELNRIKGSARSISIYSLMLAFQGDSRAFLPGTVISFDGQSRGLQAAPFLGITSAASLLGVTGGQIALNKEYLIYADNYTGFGIQSSMKGTVMVMLEISAVEKSLRDRLGEDVGLRILKSGQKVWESGPEEGRSFSVVSLADSTVEYEVWAPEKYFAVAFPLQVLFPVLLAALISLVFILIIYFQARRFYRPIDHIRRMMDERAEGENEAGKSNEFETIISGITDLIGERNGYREKMVTITPYARHGMLQAALHGAGKTETMVEEHFTELSRAWYMVAVADIATDQDTERTPRQYQDLQELMLSACRDMSGEDVQVVATPENLRHIYIIAASDEKQVFDEFFYQLYDRMKEAVEDEHTVITMGVGRRESDLDRLNEACREAQASLGQMLTGGRGAVYFPEENGEKEAGYYFPKDATRQMVRYLKERNGEGLNALLDEIYSKNLVEADLPAAQVRQMADELYWTIRKALRQAYDMSTTHVRMEPIREAATIDEIFAYYRQVFAASLQEAPVEENGEEDNSLEEEICSWLEDHLYDPDLSLNRVADQFGVSTKMVGLICRKRYSQTFLSYVRDRQIQHAAQMLRETDLSLEEISSRCGFANVLTFRRNFKAVMGVNPSEYRS